MLIAANVFKLPIFLLILLITVLTFKFFYWDLCPELFPRAHDAGKVFENLLGGVLSSVVFYIIFNAYPSYKGVRIFLNVYHLSKDKISSPLICFFYSITNFQNQDPDYRHSEDVFRDIFSQYSFEQHTPIHHSTKKFISKEITFLESIEGCVSSVHHQIENLSHAMDRHNVDDVRLLSLFDRYFESHSSFLKQLNQALDEKKSPLRLSSGYFDFCNATFNLSNYLDISYENQI